MNRRALVGAGSLQKAGWSDYAFALSLDGSQRQASYLAVGSMNSQSGFLAGAVNIYEGGPVARHSDRSRLTPPEDGGFGNFFGAHVAVHSDTYLILAPIEFGNAIYVYRIGERP